MLNRKYKARLGFGDQQDQETNDHDADDDHLEAAERPPGWLSLGRPVTGGLLTPGRYHRRRRPGGPLGMAAFAFEQCDMS